ncbi:MAG: CBS-domain-containing membrane protein [Myxococcota bacterium]|jgi:CBS-domain-containing membrane protein
MHSEPLTVTENVTVGETATLLAEKRFRSIPVVDGDGKMLGQFGVSNLLKLAIPASASAKGGLRSADFMSDGIKDLQRRLADDWHKPVGTYCDNDTETLAPDDSLTQTVLCIANGKQDNIPVVDPASNRLVGIISYWDVIDHLLNDV